MADNELPPFGVLSQLLKYDAESGSLVWLPRSPDLFDQEKGPERACKIWNARYVGKRADSVKNSAGYSVVTIFNRHFAAHRVAWFLTFGRHPQGVIDHINRDKRDNRLCNLRDVTQADNARNMSLSKKNKTGLSGLWAQSPKAWGARWAVVSSSQGRIIGKKSFKCFGAAVKFRADDLRRRGFSPTHGSPIA